jgi:transposase
MNSITDLLDLEDSDLHISDSFIDGRKKILTVELPITTHHCPCCSFKMHSRGIHVRSISHPILQDGYELVLQLKQRRWRCTNKDCKYEINDQFRFVNKRRRSTNATDFLIISAFRDLNDSAAEIARRFNTSDTHVLDVFDRYVRLKRLCLTEIISVDEVFTDMDDDCKYALVIQDFFTGDPIDILRSRRTKVTEPYFAAIPLEERCHVKYLLSDMYNNYINFVNKYFPNAVAVVDSFHVIQWVTHAIDNYIRALEKHYRQRDRARQEERSREAGRQIQLPESDEIYILKKYRWLVLMSQSNIRYHTDLRIDKHFRCLMNTYDYEKWLFKIDPRLKRLRDLKELYISFNIRNAGNPLVASEEIEDLIEIYYHSGDGIFVEFARLLSKYKEPIINSFVMVEKYGPGGLYNSRLSNGPIESLNRKVKDLKRLGRGYRNFEHFRNRFLYATRNNPALDGTGGDNQVQYYEDEDHDQP